MRPFFHESSIKPDYIQHTLFWRSFAQINRNKNGIIFKSSWLVVPAIVSYIYIFLSKSFTTTVEVSVRENSLKCCYFERHLVPLLLVMKGRKKRSFWSTKFTTVGQWLIVVKLAPFNLLKTFTPRGSLWSTNQESFPLSLFSSDRSCCAFYSWRAEAVLQWTWLNFTLLLSKYLQYSSSARDGQS